MSTTRARVMVFATAPEGHEATLEAAYLHISAELRGTPGLIANELLRSESDPRSFVVLSEWQTLDAYHAWEEGPVHRRLTAPLHRLRFMKSKRQSRTLMYAAGIPTTKHVVAYSARNAPTGDEVASSMTASARMAHHRQSRR
jgi:heme oxygenase (mycobilin-producing)